jgi:hypothetical protein
VELQASLPDYLRAGVAVFAISYDPVNALASFAEKYGITFPLLADEGSVVIERLGLLNTHVQEHHAFYGIPPRDMVVGVPYPGAFILDERGIVVDKRFHASYRERETGTGLLEAGFGKQASIHGSDVTAGDEYLTINAHLDSDTYRSMQRLRLSVDLTIASGFHVYGQPIPAGYTPLSVAVDSIDGLEVGDLEAPLPTPFRVDGLDEQFMVHAGTVRLAIPLTFTQRLGDQQLGVTVSYQLCSDTACLPPTSARMEVPVQQISHIERDV